MFDPRCTIHEMPENYLPCFDVTGHMLKRERLTDPVLLFSRQIENLREKSVELSVAASFARLQAEALAIAALEAEAELARVVIMRTLDRLEGGQ